MNVTVFVIFGFVVWALGYLWGIRPSLRTADAYWRTGQLMRLFLLGFKTVLPSLAVDTTIALIGTFGLVVIKSNTLADPPEWLQDVLYAATFIAMLLAGAGMTRRLGRRSTKPVLN